MADEDDVTTDDTETTEGDEAEGGAGDGDGLGDKGRKALADERKARRDADKRAKAAEAKLAALESQNGQQDEDAQKADQARRDAEAAANKRANERILKAEIRAAAAGKLTDPADALAHLDMSEFDVADDGTVDSDAITEAISDLIKRKPHLAAPTSQLTRDHLKNMSAAEITQAREQGRLSIVLGQPRPQGTQAPRWQRDAERQIASLELDGITQVTDAEFRTMSSRQINQARVEGRLTRILTTPNHTDGKYRQSTAG
jgi:hypothetical protein